MQGTFQIVLSTNWICQRGERQWQIQFVDRTIWKVPCIVHHDIHSTQLLALDKRLMPGFLPVHIDLKSVCLSADLCYSFLWRFEIVRYYFGTPFSQLQFYVLADALCFSGDLRH